MAWYGMVWYGIVWQRMVSYITLAFGCESYFILWYDGMVCYDIVSYGMVWYEIVCYGMA